MTDDRILVIDRRFNGPPTSGNGGWVAGALARRLDAARVSVSLRAPPPLGVPLEVRDAGPGRLSLHQGETLLAEAQVEPDATADEPDDLLMATPLAPPFDSAEAAGVLGRMRAQGRQNSPYAHCFSCGIAREDGLRIVPAPVGDAGMVAATWTPGPAVAQPDGEVDVETVWAVLDCPAGVAWSYQLPDAPPMMTVRMTATVDRAPRVGEPCIVAGWPIVREGRKLHAGTAVYDASGRVLARSRQIWLLPRS